MKPIRRTRVKWVWPLGMIGAVLLLVSGGAAFAQTNLLQNGSFSGGLAPWTGDATPAPGGGAVLTLGPNWEKISQGFAANGGNFVLTVKYQLSPDCQFSTDPHMGGNVIAKAGLSNLGAFGSRPGQWYVVFYDAFDRHEAYWRLMPNHTLASQTVNCTFKVDSADGQTGESIVLIFPPGTGTVTLQEVSFAPASGAP